MFTSLTGEFIFYKQYARAQSFHNFILCLLEIARFGSKFGIQVPTIIKFELEIEAELEREKQCKKDELALLNTEAENSKSEKVVAPVQENGTEMIDLSKKIAPLTEQPEITNSKKAEKTQIEFTELMSSGSMRNSSFLDFEKASPQTSTAENQHDSS
jgi:hypothetical protein